MPMSTEKDEYEKTIYKSGTEQSFADLRYGADC